MNFTDVAISLAKVLGVGLVLGAGLPMIFSLGLKGLARTRTQADGTQAVSAGGRATAAASFLVVGAAVVVGIVWIVSGGH